jgi:hypothetical protein
VKAGWDAARVMIWPKLSLVFRCRTRRRLERVGFGWLVLFQLLPLFPGDSEWRATRCVTSDKGEILIGISVDVIRAPIRAGVRPFCAKSHARPDWRRCSRFIRSRRGDCGLCFRFIGAAAPLRRICDLLTGQIQSSQALRFGVGTSRQNVGLSRRAGRAFCPARLLKGDSWNE